MNTDHVTIFRLLAKGRPLSVAEIASEIGRSRDVVRDRLRSLYRYGLVRRLPTKLQSQQPQRYIDRWIAQDPRPRRIDDVDELLEAIVYGQIP